MTDTSYTATVLALFESAEAWYDTALEQYTETMFVQIANTLYHTLQSEHFGVPWHVIEGWNQR